MTCRSEGTGGLSESGLFAAAKRPCPNIRKALFRVDYLKSKRVYYALEWSRQSNRTGESIGNEGSAAAYAHMVRIGRPHSDRSRIL